MRDAIFLKDLVSGFKTPFTLHQVPETLFLNGGIKEFVYYKKKVASQLFIVDNSISQEYVYEDCEPANVITTAVNEEVCKWVFILLFFY